MRRVFLMLAGSLFAAHAFAQMPTQEQIQMFNALPQDQRDAILEQLGMGASGDTGARPPASTTRPSASSPPGDAATATTGEVDEAQGAGVDPRTANARPPKLGPEDTLIVRLKLPPVELIPSSQEGQPPVVFDPTADWNPLDKEKYEKIIARVHEKNPYRLTREGVLLLPGFAPMPMLGLTEKQAIARLSAEPQIANLSAEITRLPLQKTGTAALKPFGYEMFRDERALFQSDRDVPVPADYIVGPGDQLTIQLYGSQNKTLKLTVGRDGRIAFPELGPISVAGQSYAVVKQEIEDRIARQMIGVTGSVSLGDIRAVQVFVVGEVKQPGAHTVSGLGTVTTALYSAGGITDIGSLRNIKQLRQGRVVRTLDLYDMLMRGDARNDGKLVAGDVILVPPVAATAAVSGEVLRPAIYEIKGETSVGEIIRLAGGLTSDGDPRSIYITRVDEQQRRVVIDVDLGNSEDQAMTLRKGDAVRVSRLRPTLDSGVLLAGHVHQPGAVAYRSGLRLSDVIRSIDELQPNADAGYVLIRRELAPDRRIAVLSADLDAALRAPRTEADPPLMPRDQIFVFDLESGREAVIKPLLNDIRLQSSAALPTRTVQVAGAVKVRGEYPLEQGMRIADLVRAGGGLDDSAYGATAELTRLRVVGNERLTETVEIDLASALAGDLNSNLVLQPYDILLIKEVPEWREQEIVKLEGEVLFPGEYPIRRGESLREVIERAGGLTNFASPRAAVFTRESLRKREQAQMDRLAEQLQRSLAVAALQSAQANQSGASTALSVGQTLMSDLRNAKAVGRLVIDLDASLAAAPGTEADIILQGGDRLLIPKHRQEVTVIGEVQNSTSHFFKSGLTRDDYIGLSGGATRRADDSHIYVVRADGSVVAGSSNSWFARSSQVKMEPGDTVVVPLDAERLPMLPLWQAVTQILYNVAISVAAINSF